MNLLKDLEKKLERIFEGFFIKAFKSNIQPIEIAKKLSQHMNDKKTISLKKIYAPNQFQVYLSPEDFEIYFPFKDALTLELADYLKNHAEKAGYLLLGKIKIGLAPREILSLGEIEIESKIVEEKLAISLEDTQTITKKEAFKEELFHASALLALLGKGRIYYLTKPVTTLGRLDSNDIALASPSVSRVHAEIIEKNNKYILKDLESTNGTFVNGKRVREKSLRDGDTISLGDVKLEFRRIKIE